MDGAAVVSGRTIASLSGARLADPAEADMLELMRRRHRLAKADKMSGEVVIRVRYKQGGVVSKRSEIVIDEQ